ncbi:MAG: PadR family transcriptional regulator [Scytonema sp. PMC 1069.18]|nr:PadR family transcriptional regulator [Scytonema sp. PMC 1069.18]MEC4880941.1 PadR family transcriptional regulator [Scytonema sp. PMC 1070.18]
MNREIQVSGFALSRVEEYVLRALLGGEQRYGNQIMDGVGEFSYGQVSINPGNLYPALRRLEKSGLIASEKENKRLEIRKGNRRVYYKITPKGRAVIAEIEEFYRKLEEKTWKLRSVPT